MKARVNSFARLLSTILPFVFWLAPAPCHADTASDARDAATVIDNAVLAASELYGTEPFHYEIKTFLSLTAANLRAMANTPAAPFDSVALLTDVPSYGMLISDILSHASTVNEVLTDPNFDPTKAAVVFKVVKDAWDVGWIILTKTGMHIATPTFSNPGWEPFLDGGLLTGAGAANLILGYDFFIVGQVLNLELSVVSYGVGIIHAGEEANSYARTLIRQSFFGDAERAIFNDYFATISANSVYRPLLELFSQGAGIAGYVPKENYNVFDFSPAYGWFGMGRLNWTIAAEGHIVTNGIGQKLLQIGLWTYTHNTEIVGDNSADGKPLPQVAIQFLTNGMWTTVQLGVSSNLWGVADGTAHKDTLYGPKCTYSLEVPLPSGSGLPSGVRTLWMFPNSSDTNNLTVFTPAQLDIQSPNLTSTYLTARANTTRHVSIPITFSSVSPVHDLQWKLTPLNSGPGTSNSVCLPGVALNFTGFLSDLGIGQSVPASLEMDFPTNVPPGTFTGMLEVWALNASSLSLAVQVIVPPDLPLTFTTLAGLAGCFGSADGIGNSARFEFPEGMAVDSAGYVYVADTENNTVRKVSPAGLVTTLAGAGEAGSADGTGSDARFYFPYDVAVDSGGNVYVADCNNQTVRKISPAGVVSTFAGSPGACGGADGTGSAARFCVPQGVAVDAQGNVYVAEYYTVRKISPAGEVTTLAGSWGYWGSNDGTGGDARFCFPTSVAVDGGGNVYVADHFNHTIRKINATGNVTTLAGSAGNPGSVDGIGTSAQFYYPDGVAVDSSGNVYVADGNQTIRKVTPAGVVTTLAGSADNPGSNDGTGSEARFYNPRHLAVDGQGLVYVVDTVNCTVRVGAVTAVPAIEIPPHSGTVQGGSGATFSVSVAGLPPLSYQWLHNGSPIAGASSNSLTIPNSQAYDAGAYSVVVSNRFGAVTSVVALLAVTAPPLPTALNAQNLPWSSSGSASWFGVTDCTHDGVSAARSGGLTNNQQTALATSVEGPGIIRFWWRVSSEADHDLLRFYVGGSEQASVSGETSWQQRSFPVPPGQQTLRWEYSRDGSGSGGQDAGWVDQVQYSPPVPVSLSPSVSLDGSHIQFSFQGDVGIAYELQTSTNLADWATAQAVTNITGTTIFVAPMNGSASQFYRLKLIQ